MPAVLSRNRPRGWRYVVRLSHCLSLTVCVKISRPPFQVCNKQLRAACSVSVALGTAISAMLRMPGVSAIREEHLGNPGRQDSSLVLKQRKC
ncbi:hypothetical protein ElyMa_000259900 [Elysia marginata]|uniref:Uncharacterized protein n=1 Tax=Elysia marginata TaxID=1093978 RepID=A0AAV4F385_9GAST|nr:hypothetical protein ElyMa_000259900 [Elysia marginata]